MPHLHPLPSGTDLLALHRQAPARYPLLLESVATGTAQGRWDLLLAADGSGLQLGDDGITRDLAGAAHDGTFLDVLDGRWRQEQVAADEPRWPFHGGWALLLDYELAAQVAPVVDQPRRSDAGRPLALALRCPAAVLRDRASGECGIVAESGHEALLQSIAGDQEAARRLKPLPAWQAPQAIVEDEPQGFLDGVGRILEYLRAGDVFQVNLSRAWRAHFDAPLDPAALYARLRRANPAPFGGLFAGDGWAVASC
jgi:anthranilate synthase component 1